MELVILGRQTDDFTLSLLHNGGAPTVVAEESYHI